jgi:hypothetical protein
MNLLTSRNTLSPLREKMHSESTLCVNKMRELPHDFFVFEMIRTLEGETLMAKTVKKTATRAKAKKPAARKPARKAVAKKPAAKKRKAA